MAVCFAGLFSLCLGVVAERQPRVTPILHVHFEWLGDIPVGHGDRGQQRPLNRALRATLTSGRLYVVGPPLRRTITVP